MKILATMDQKYTRGALENEATFDILNFIIKKIVAILVEN